MGGKCFNDVSRINKEFINDTVSKFLKETSISSNSVCFLGSTNKKPSSGDIDLGLEPIDNLENILKLKLGSSNVRKIGKLITCRYPIANNLNNNECVQIDLLQGEISWLKTLYHHSDNSLYTGSHRNGAIRAIFRIINCSITFDKNEAISKNKYMWSPSNGLCYVNQYRKLIKNKYVKTWSTDIVSTCTIESIPATIFNSKFATFNDIDSLESIIDAINIYYKDVCEDIFKEIAFEFATMQFDKSFQYPDCIKKYEGIE